MKNKELEGCVFYFFNEYQSKRNKKETIYKIFKLDLFIRNELTNCQKLFKINNRKQHFYISENVSELNLVLQNDIASQKYSKGTNIDDTILLEFEDKKTTIFKNYLKTTLRTNATKYILTIIQFYKHLLTSLQLLLTNHIFYNHIHFDSIVVDKFDYPLLSNFAFSIDYSLPNIRQHIRHFVIAYEPSYIEWPLELHILSYLLTNKLDSLSSYNIETIINDVIEHNNILKTFGDSVVSLYKKEASNYFNKYINQTFDVILDDVLQHIGTWDNYSLSILFLRILIGIHRTIEIKNKFIILFMKLLVGNIHLNPLKRSSVKSTKEQFNLLMDSLSPKDYTNVIERLVSS